MLAAVPLLLIRLAAPTLAGIALAGLAGAAQALPLWDRETQIRLAGSLVRIEAITRSGGYSFGSGVLIAPKRLVTNCHVTRDAVQVSAVQGGQRFPAAAQAADVHHDLCVLEIPGVTGTPAATGGPPLTAGQPLLGMGFTGGIGLQFSEGELASLHLLDGQRVLRSTNSFTSGASGGALFDAQGRLRGVLTFRLRGGPAHYFSVPAEWIAEVTADPSRFVPVAPLEGRTFWEQEAPVPFLRATTLGFSQQWQALARFAQGWSDDEPSESAAPLALGEALERLGQWERAELALTRALAIDPALAEGWWRLGRVLAQLGRVPEARAALARLVPLNDTLARQLAALLDNR